jgi:hypothetical protein
MIIWDHQGRVPTKVPSEPVGTFNLITKQPRAEHQDLPQQRKHAQLSQHIIHYYWLVTTYAPLCTTLLSKGYCWGVRSSAGKALRRLGAWHCKRLHDNIAVEIVQCGFQPRKMIGVNHHEGNRPKFPQTVGTQFVITKPHRTTAGLVRVQGSTWTQQEGSREKHSKEHDRQAKASLGVIQSHEEEGPHGTDMDRASSFQPRKMIIWDHQGRVPTKVPSEPVGTFNVITKLHTTQGL